MLFHDLGDSRAMTASDSFLLQIDPNDRQDAGKICWSGVVPASALQRRLLLVCCALPTQEIVSAIILVSKNEGMWIKSVASAQTGRRFVMSPGVRSSISIMNAVISFISRRPAPASLLLPPLPNALRGEIWRYSLFAAG